MGTSQSSPGPGGGTPLVPPWADDQPDVPLPLPEPVRYSTFRRALGNFIKSSDRADLESALGHYSRKGSGGSNIAARRMGSVTRAGTALYRTLAGVGGSGSEAETSINLNALAGQPCDVAIEAIVQALSKADGDSNKIRTSMKDALAAALDGMDIFDPGRITDEVIVNTMINYLSGAVFLQIVLDGGRAWTKAETPIQIITAENALFELIKVNIDKHMAPKFSGNVRSLTNSAITSLQREVIIAVWKDWEDYS